MTEKINEKNKGGFGYPLLGDGRGKVDFVCPHCNDKDECASRVQGNDDLMWKTLHPDNTELWECNGCGGYFFLVYKLERIIKLSSDN